MTEEVPKVQPPATNLTWKDGAAGISTLVPIAIAILGDAHRYELLGSAAVLFIFYMLYRMHDRRIVGLEIANAESKRETKECQAELRVMAATHMDESRAERKLYGDQIGMMQATILNMHMDLVVFAGDRATGQFEYDSELGMYKYTRAPRPIPPAGIDERRGVRDPEAGP